MILLLFRVFDSTVCVIAYSKRNRWGSFFDIQSAARMESNQKLRNKEMQFVQLHSFSRVSAWMSVVWCVCVCLVYMLNSCTQIKWFNNKRESSLYIFSHIPKFQHLRNTFRRENSSESLSKRSTQNVNFIKLKSNWLCHLLNENRQNLHLIDKNLIYSHFGKTNERKKMKRK